jgi:hypothetical protein
VLIMLDKQLLARWGSCMNIFKMEYVGHLLMFSLAYVAFKSHSNLADYFNKGYSSINFSMNTNEIQWKEIQFYI